MENKANRSKHNLNHKKQKLSEKFAELSIDPHTGTRQGLSLSLSNSLKKLNCKNSVSKNKIGMFSPKISIGQLPYAASAKRFGHKHGNSLQMTPSSKTFKKEKLVPLVDLSKVEMNGKVALTYFKSELTDYEKAEILDYQDVYYIGKHCNKLKNKLTGQNYGFDDERGDYYLVVGDHIAYRYEILSLLGKGNFGQVALCHDHKRNEKTALKIVRNKSRFNQQAAIEIKVLQTLRENDPEGKNHVIKIKNFFVFRKHVCMTFERLSMNLYELLHKNNFEGFSVSLIQKFTVQILRCLEYSFRFSIVHCDLKPENIMLVKSSSAEINVIDFGSSCFEAERLYTYIQSRFYRAPEIILGIPYTTAIDMWSLGCIVTEFFTGYPLFIGENEHDQLVFIIEALGLPSEEVVKMSTRSKLFFDAKGAPKLPENRKTMKSPGSKKICSVLNGAPDELIDFVSKCLTWNPSDRMKPLEALSHPFAQVKRKKVHKSRSKNISTSIS